MRAAFGGAYALDFGAVFQVATALGANQRLLAEVLPGVESVLIQGLRPDDAGDGPGDGD